jgi:hypothetical protein
MHILNYQYRKEHALQKVTSVTEMFMNYDIAGIRWLHCAVHKDHHLVQFILQGPAKAALL